MDPLRGRKGLPMFVSGFLNVPLPVECSMGGVWNDPFGPIGVVSLGLGSAR